MNPDQHTISEQLLAVTDGHAVYVHEWGNPQATSKFIFLHGGPGGGCSDSNKANFDPALHHVLFFDQRGSGKSVPYGSRKANTTTHLIADISAIADAYAFEHFALLGGSWGSTLALAYAIEHPERVEALILRVVFTGSQDEIDFIDQGGFAPFFPEVWEAFLAATPSEHHHAPAAYHIARALGPDPVAAKASAYAYTSMEGALIKLDDRYTPYPYEDFDPTSTQIELHYLSQGCFLPAEHILTQASSLTMPVWIVQGRYDAVCPPTTAYTLHQLLPNSQLSMVPAGHSGSDRAIYDVTRTITRTLARTT